MDEQDSLWECVKCSHYNRVELKKCENCEAIRMIEIKGEVPEGFFEWFDELFNSKRINDKEREILSQVDIRTEDNQAI